MKKQGGASEPSPGERFPRFPHRRGGAPTAILSPTRRSAAVRMGPGSTPRPPEAEWSSGVAVFLGGVL